MNLFLYSSLREKIVHTSIGLLALSGGYLPLCEPFCEPCILDPEKGSQSLGEKGLRDLRGVEGGDGGVTGEARSKIVHSPWERRGCGDLGMERLRCGERVESGSGERVGFVVVRGLVVFLCSVLSFVDTLNLEEGEDLGRCEKLEVISKRGSPETQNPCQLFTDRGLCHLCTSRSGVTSRLEKNLSETAILCQ